MFQEMYMTTIGRFGTTGGELLSTVNSEAKVIFPPGALLKEMQIEIHVQNVSKELCEKITGYKVKSSPIVTIDPRRRKLHKPITIVMPAPFGCSARDIVSNNPYLRLLCSTEAKENPIKWVDITASISFSALDTNCISFESSVSAVFWCLYCTSPHDIVELANNIYSEL